MATGAELIELIKRQIEEVQPSEAHDELLSSNGSGSVALVDVREQHEFEERHIPGAIHVPRGHLETRIEQFVPNKDQRVIIYCASGNRSAFAARTMAEEIGFSGVGKPREEQQQCPQKPPLNAAERRSKKTGAMDGPRAHPRSSGSSVVVYSARLGQPIDMEVPSPTQARYSGRPRTTGTAMISGSS